MKPNDFVNKCIALDTNYININRRLRSNQKLQELIHGAMGMAGETGEVVDLIKKHMVYDKPLDVEKLKLELGDTLYYMAVIIDSIDSSFEEVMQMNVDKLAKRYPNGFTEQAAIERRDVQK